MASFKNAPWSYWELESLLSGYPVAILGSGIVGLSTAIFLKRMQPDLPVLVLERGPLPTGASTRNAGFACFGSMTELLDDLSHQPADAVWSLVERRYRGLQRLRGLIGDTRMRYEPLGGYEVFPSSEEAIFQTCLEALPAFNRHMQPITGRTDTFQIADAHISRFGFQSVRHLIKNTGEGQIHTGETLAALLALARQMHIEILNGMEVHAIDPDASGVWLHFEQGSLHFEKVLIATNGMAQQLLPELEVEPARNQVLITQPIPNLPLQGSFHYDKGYIYFRNIDQRVLLGGARNSAFEEERTDLFGTTTAIQQTLLNLLKEVILPGVSVEVDRWWSGIMGVGESKSPIVRMLHPHLGVAVRMGGMGVAIGSLVGEEAAQMLLQN